MTVSDSTDDGAGEGTGGSDRPALPAGLLDHATTTGDEGSMPVEEPYTGTVFAEIPTCGGAAVDRAVGRAREAGEAWADRPAEARAAVIERFHDLLLDRQAELLDVLQVETGKARRHAYDEVLSAATTARHYAVRAGGYLEPERRRGALPGLTRTEVFHEPKGVVGLIVPWNYPFELAVSDAIPALLAGNAVVCKPAEQTTHTALYALKLLRAAGLPEDVFQVVPGRGPDLGPPLVERVDHVGFTGSTEAGRTVASLAGERLTSCSLELGGKNAAIVRADADLGRTVDGLVRGCFDNAGQTCIGIERIYVHRSVHGEFLERFVAAAEALEPAATYDWDSELGSLVSADQLDRVESAARALRARSAATRQGATARRTLSVSLPVRTWAHPGLAELTIPPPGGRAAVTWRVEGGPEHSRRLLGGDVVGPPGGLTLRSGGIREVVLLLRPDGTVQVRRLNFITERGSTAVYGTPIPAIGRG